MSRPVYCFLHIPKTGGTTISRHLRESLPDGAYVGVYEKREELPLPKAGAVEALRAIGGHFVRYRWDRSIPADTRWFTVFRDPADRVLSAYNFQTQKFGLDLSLEEWIVDHPENVGLKKLNWAFDLDEEDDLLDAARTALRGMWFVGVTDSLNEDLPHIFRHLGAPQEWTDQRVATADVDEVDESLDLNKRERWQVGQPVLKRLEMTDDLRSLIYSHNQRDLKLYRLARRLREKRLHRLHGPEPRWGEPFPERS